MGVLAGIFGVAAVVAVAFGVGEDVVALGTTLGLADGVTVTVTGGAVAAARGLELGCCALSDTTPIRNMESASNKLRVRGDLGRSLIRWPMVALLGQSKL